MLFCTGLPPWAQQDTCKPTLGRLDPATNWCLHQSTSLRMGFPFDVACKENPISNNFTACEYPRKFIHLHLGIYLPQMQQQPLVCVCVCTRLAFTDLSICQGHKPHHLGPVEFQAPPTISKPGKHLSAVLKSLDLGIMKLGSNLAVMLRSKICCLTSQNPR